MKIKLFTATLALALSASVIFPAGALAAKAKTDVTGFIQNGGQAVKDANVSVKCDGKTKTTKTNNHGLYSVRFNGNLCPDGSTVTVTATKDNLSGTTTGTAYGVNCRLNVAIVNVAVPELGTVAALTAAVGGAGAFLYQRRRAEAIV